MGSSPTAAISAVWHERTSRRPAARAPVLHTGMRRFESCRDEFEGGCGLLVEGEDACLASRRSGFESPAVHGLNGREPDTVCRASVLTSALLAGMRVRIPPLPLVFLLMVSVDGRALRGCEPCETGFESRRIPWESFDGACSWESNGPPKPAHRVRILAPRLDGLWSVRDSTRRFERRRPGSTPGGGALAGW